MSAEAVLQELEEVGTAADRLRTMRLRPGARLFLRVLGIQVRDEAQVSEFPIDPVVVRAPEM